MNWVKRRAQCEPERFFRLLRQRVQRDMERANEHLGDGEFRIQNDETMENWLIVIRKQDGEGIAFNLVDDGINVEKFKGKKLLHCMFEVTCEWDSENQRCRRLIDGTSTNG